MVGRSARDDIGIFVAGRSELDGIGQAFASDADRCRQRDAVEGLLVGNDGQRFWCIAVYNDIGTCARDNRSARRQQ